MPNPDLLLSAGDTVVISNPSSSDTITLKTDDGLTVYYAHPDVTGSNLTTVSNPFGTSWKLWLSYTWTHDGQVDPTPQNVKVPADWWGE